MLSEQVTLMTDRVELFPKAFERCQKQLFLTLTRQLSLLMGSIQPEQLCGLRRQIPDMSNTFLCTQCFVYALGWF